MNVLNRPIMNPSLGEISADEIIFDPVSLDDMAEDEKVAKPDLTRDEAERMVVERAIEACNGDRAAAARRLNIGYSTLRRKQRKWHLSDTEGKK
jgi:DNA-binding NtrC family response regulator